MSKPQVLILGQVLWARKELDEIIGPLAEILWCESKTKDEFKADCKTKYSKIVGVYEHEGMFATVGKPNAELINALPSTVQFWAHNGAGYDKLDVDACLARGISASHTPGAVDNATATTAVFLILASIRQFYKAEKSVRAGNWKNDLPLARDPENKTLGIVGMGGIGALVAKRMHLGWGMKILYHNRSPVKAGGAGAEYEYCASLEEMLGRCDVVSLNLPLNANTEKSFGAKQFGWMKKGSVLVNTARGGVVDEPALFEALKSGHLYSAGIDVFPNEPDVNPEYLKYDNISILPHMGTETSDSRWVMEMTVIKNMESYLKEGKMINLVAEHKGHLQ
ncbi:D-isomer specific 2-hydroxyacid dehydrogenase [Mrakia frigida]|uniref:D-mandelate dehydrogenase-like dehydrogenase n=1 Tax=Mrakia frigida TaxID=29902 RepID=UPI003FCC095D